VVVQEREVIVPEAVEQASRSLDVGEDKGHRPRREPREGTAAPSARVAHAHIIRHSGAIREVESHT
jgi:hypothetical protein